MKQDHLAGILLIVLGLGGATEGYRHPLGTLQEMGPGLMPFVLSLVLVLLGVLVAATAGRQAAGPDLPSMPGGHDEFGGAEWRGWGCIVGGIAAFLVLAVWGGLVPAAFACVFIAALGDRGGSVREAVLLAAGVTMVGAVLFWWLLKIQLPLFRWGI